MRISVNLATHPFVELRPVYNRLRTWMVILALVALALWFLYRMEHAQAQLAMTRMNNVEDRVQELQTQQRDYQALMQQPQDAAILQQSDFLNSLFRRKAFSWTATMTDLENVLPAGVEVLSIDPIIAPDGHVTIRLRVTGARTRGLDLIRNLEKSKHFANPRLASETLATQAGSQGNVQTISAGGDVNFDILADYRPLPLNAAAEEKEEASPVVRRKHSARTANPQGVAHPPAEQPPHRAAGPPVSHSQAGPHSPAAATTTRPQP